MFIFSSGRSQPQTYAAHTRAHTHSHRRTVRREGGGCANGRDTGYKLDKRKDGEKEGARRRRRGHDAHIVLLKPFVPLPPVPLPAPLQLSTTAGTERRTKRSVGGRVFAQRQDALERRPSGVALEALIRLHLLLRSLPIVPPLLQPPRVRRPYSASSISPGSSVRVR